MSSNAFRELASNESLHSAWNGLNKSNLSSCGTDRVTILDFRRDLSNQLKKLCSDLQSGRFRFQPLKPHEIPKDKLNPLRGKRILKIPSVRDRVVLKALQEFVAPRLDKFNAPFSFAYQDKKNVEKAVAEIFRLSRMHRFVIEADIKSYFDQIPVQLLSDALFKVLRQPSLRPLIEAALHVEAAILTTTGDSINDYFSDDSRGIPQGSALSPTLANYYLFPFDFNMAKKGIPMVRYADDLVLFADTEEKANHVFLTAKKYLECLGLSVHPLEKTKDSKSKLRDVQINGIEALGYRIENGRVLPGGRFVRRTNDEIKEITNPATVGVGFRGAPTGWAEDTILSRAFYLRKMVEGKAAAIRMAAECPQIHDINKNLNDGFINLFNACGMSLGTMNEKAVKKLGIPRFKEIWEKKRRPLPSSTMTVEAVQQWVKRISVFFARAFPTFGRE